MLATYVIEKKRAKMRSLKKATVAWLQPGTNTRHAQVYHRKKKNTGGTTYKPRNSMTLYSFACNTNTHKPQLNIWTVSQKRFTKRVYFSLRFATTLP